MAGAGYKLFNTGDVLTAAQVNTYLQEQTVMVFASSTARTTALSGVLAEGMVSYLQDTNAVEVYNGSAWVGVSGAGDVTEVQAGVGISVASGTGPIPVITNSSTDLITTAGDLLYGTAADTVARLGIGTAGQVLTVNSGATAPEWAAAASSSGPVARAYRATTDQNIGQNTFTKVELNAEDFDTDNCYDPTTNYRFTPNKAGKYLVTVNASYDSAGRSIWAVYKNGTAFQRVIHTIDGYGAPIIGGACMVDMNGTTDYLEIYALMVDAGTRAILNSSSTGTSATFSFVRS